MVYKAKGHHSLAWNLLMPPIQKEIGEKKCNYFQDSIKEEKQFLKLYIRQKVNNICKT